MWKFFVLGSKQTDECNVYYSYAPQQRWPSSERDRWLICRCEFIAYRKNQIRKAKYEDRRFECVGLWSFCHCVICVVSRKSRISCLWWRRRIIFVSQGFKFIFGDNKSLVLYVYALRTRGYYVSYPINTVNIQHRIGFFTIIHSFIQWMVCHSRTCVRTCDASIAQVRHSERIEQKILCTTLGFECKFKFIQSVESNANE